jgi:hypothetical protein
MQPENIASWPISVGSLKRSLFKMKNKYIVLIAVAALLILSGLFCRMWCCIMPIKHWQT